MRLDELQSAICEELRPRAKKLAGRHPDFVARVIRRLVERTPSRCPAHFFECESDRDDFVADVAIEMEEHPDNRVGSILLVLLIQVLLPALIRALLLWWSGSAEHRRDLIELRDRLAAATPCDNEQ